MKNIFLLVVTPVISYFCCSISYCYVINKTFAGNKTISECLDAESESTSKLKISTINFIRSKGFKAEEHLVLTEDGYLLTLHRIPGNVGAPAVLVVHGLLASSFVWVVSGTKEALAFYLAKEGYDVWLANLRGNRYSKCNLYYTTNEYSYWNFSFHEMGMYDLPSMINEIKNTNSGDLFYVGHSLGTTVFYVMASKRLDVVSKVKAMFSFAPVAFLSHMKSPISIFAPFSTAIKAMVDFASNGKISISSELMDIILKYGCNISRLQTNICLFLVFSLTGFDYSQFNITRFPIIFNHFPQATSIKTVDHYSQGIISGKFRQYDYGAKENEKIYNNSIPPNYDLSKIELPIGVFWGENDYIVDRQDVFKFCRLIPKKMFCYKIKYPKFNHLDFIWGIDARRFVYEKFVSALKNISGSSYGKC